MSKYTIKSTNKAALKEYDQKSDLYQTMHVNKSFNRNPANHALYHALMEALIEDENAMDKGVADTEPVEAPIVEVVMDDGVNTAGEDAVHDDNLPQDTSEPKTYKTPNQDWFKQPPRPPTPDPEWNKHQVILDQPEQPWFNQMVSATKDPLTFNDLMATPIDFSKYCFNALTDKLDWNNPEGDHCPFDLSKPLPLQGRPCHLTVSVDHFFNNDLEYLKTSDPEKTYTTSITKTKAARYEIVGIKDMTPTLWSTIKHTYDKDAEKGIKYWGERRKLWYRSQLIDSYKSLKKVTSWIYTMLLLAVQHKLFHLNDSDIVDFIVALHMFTRSLIVKRRVEDLQLGVESYQKKLNITAPQKTFPEIEFKELYTPSYKSPGVIYEELNKQKQVMQADELYKFSDGTLKTVRDELPHRILDFCLGYNDEMSRRKWMAIDKKRSKLMVELIDKQMRERPIIRNLKRLVGARELEMDYKLMIRTV
ncbi:hypothetical protein Tco_0289818 [Tanacetum coccineum]